MIDEYRGSLRVRAWPTARPGRRHATNEYWTKWLKAATYLYRYQPARVQDRLQRITAGTPWMPRDVFISAMRGRAFQLTDQDGRKYYTMAMRQDVSDSLDAIAQLPGDMLYRASGLWAPVHAGTPGHLLQSQGPDAAPEWVPPPSAAYLILPIVSGLDQTLIWNVNSTAYRTQDQWSVPVDIDLFPYTHFRLQVAGQAVGAADTISVIVAARGNPTVPLGGTDPLLSITNTSAVYTSGWIERTEIMTGFARTSISCKGNNFNADLRVRQMTLSLARM